MSFRCGQKDVRKRQKARRIARQSGSFSARFSSEKGFPERPNAIFSRKVCESRHIKVQKAILCCQNWHARRCLMYYGQQFPETQFFVCPVSTRGITRDNWYLDPERADVVLSEVERCGAQFHEIVRHYQEGKAYCRPVFPEDRTGCG